MLKCSNSHVVNPTFCSITSMRAILYYPLLFRLLLLWVSGNGLQHLLNTISQLSSRHFTRLADKRNLQCFETPRRSPFKHKIKLRRPTGIASGFVILKPQLLDTSRCKTSTTQSPPDSATSRTSVDTNDMQLKIRGLLIKKQKKYEKTAHLPCPTFTSKSKTFLPDKTIAQHMVA